MEDELIELGLRPPGLNRPSDTTSHAAVSLFDRLLVLMHDMAIPAAQLESEGFKEKLNYYRQRLASTPTLDVEAAMVSVGNGTSYGGGMLIAPGASLTDGLLDVIVVSPRSRFRLVRLFPTVYRGTHVDLDEVQVFRTRSLRLIAPDIVAYADGEPIAPLPLDIEAVPGAGRVLVGAPVR